MDRRSEKECDWLRANVGQDLVFKINGNHIDPSNIAPKLLWIKANEPEVYEKARCFLHANGYLVYKLTGRLSMDISEGGLTHLFDTAKGEWSSELLEACGIDRAKLPEIYSCSQVVGGVTAEAASATGLLSGTPVVAGAMDMVASALGAGALASGQAYVAAGTVTAVGVCLDEVRYHQDFHIYHHAVPGKWILAAGVDFGGGSLRWFRDQFSVLGRFSGISSFSGMAGEVPIEAPSDDDGLSYEELYKHASTSEPGASGLIFLPYMAGNRAPLWDTYARGVMFGLAPFHTVGDFIRALMEGNAFGVADILHRVEEIGFKVEELRLTGGCSKVPLWSQIFADITGKRIFIPDIEEVAAYGAAILGGLGVGIFSDEKDVLKSLRTRETYCPRTEYAGVYSHLYRVFKKVYSDLKGDFKLLAEETDL